MAKKRLDAQFRQLTKKQRMIVLPLMVIVGGSVIFLAIWAIMASPAFNNSARRGVAANGFSAYAEKGTDIGVGNVVTKAQVASALGSKAKAVADVNVSSVFNYNGDRSQTATFDFARADGKKATLYVDKTIFKSTDSMADQHILAETALARVIKGHSTYYMHAQTIGTVREYRIAVINDLTAYKLVIDQPVNNITINEVAAAASLINLAEQAQF